MFTIQVLSYIIIINYKSILRGIMGSADKKFILELPLKVVLTEDGASNFISHNKKLLRFRLADNVEEYGVSLNKFSPQSVQSMILLDYIHLLILTKKNSLLKWLRKQIS